MTTANTVNGAEAILEFLRLQGTEYIFCSPIAVWAPLWEALAQRRERGEPESPRYLNCRHEILAVGLASGVYKATGRAQVVLLPTGLGVLHGALAVRSALQERIPMLILAPDTLTYGAVPSLDPGPEWPSLLVDFTGPVRDGEVCVKWANEVKTAEQLIAELRRAYYFAEMVPRGPTLLSVPFDILMSPVPRPRQPKLHAHPVVAPAEHLAPIAEVLARSQNPIIITEHAGRTPEEVNTLVQLAELLSAPVFEFWMPSFQNFPRAHPLYGSGPVEAVLPEADCIVVAGANAPWHPPNIELKEGCTVIVFEEDPLRPRAPYWGYRTDYGVAGDIGLNLAELYRQLKGHLSSPPAARAERWEEDTRRRRKQSHTQAGAMPSGAGVPAASLFQALQHALPAGAAVVDEIVAQTPFMLQTLFQAKPFNHYRGWAGALGTGIATALGVKLAEAHNVVVCVIGDGAFSYNPVPACFGLAQQYRLPILIVICNNQGYASQAWNLEKYFPQGAAVSTRNYYGKVIEPTPDYWKLAAAFDGHGERVSAPESLAPAIQRGLAAMADGHFAVLDVLVEA
jgi:acetolactate synthase I/II/III large subunit